MRIILYVFSGTGNTLKIANRYLEELLPNEVTIYQVSGTNIEVPNPNDYDLVGFGYPIHAFNTPFIFDSFTRNLPNVIHKPAFIFKTSGEPLAINNSSSQHFLRKLAKRGYYFLSERHYIMPYNMILKHSDAFAKQMWIYAKALVKVHVRELLTFKKERVKKIFFKRVHTFIFRIEWIYARIQGPSFKVDLNKCIKCFKCIDNCPTQNISYQNGHFNFAKKCTLCVRCSFNCPKDAIKIGLLNGWKVNGDYHVDELVKNDSITFPYVPNANKTIQKIYGKYFKNADKYLKEQDIDLQDIE